MISSKNLAKALYVLSREDKISSQDLTSSFFKYVDEYKLHSLLPQTIKYLEGFNKKDLDFNTLRIDFGHESDDGMVKEIQKKINASLSDSVESKEDKELIGGFVATYKGMIYDASIKNQLQLLKQELIKS